jgi:hypothetical protein
MVSSILMSSKTLSQNRAQTHKATIQSGSDPKDDIHSRCMVHPNLQTQRMAMEQQFGVSHMQTGHNSEDGIYSDYWSSSNNSNQHPGSTCQPPTDGTPAAQSMSPCSGANGNPSSIPPTPHSIPTTSKDIYQDSPLFTTQTID